MAQSNSYDWVLLRIREKGVQCYQLLEADKKTVITEDMTGELSADDVVRELSEILPNLSGTVYIKLSAKSAEEKGKGGNLRGDQLIQLNLGSSNNKAAINGFVN